MVEIAPSREASQYNFRKLFHTHVAAVAVTVAVVIPLLLGIASIPNWVAVAYCSLIGCAAIGFAIATIAYLRRDSLMSAAARSEFLLVSIGLSTFQLICVALVLLAIFAPSLRLVSPF